MRKESRIARIARKRASYEEGAPVGSSLASDGWCREAQVILVIAVACILAGSALAEDWPTYQHDNRRSGVTSEQLAFPLEQRWLYRSPIPPQTAWTGPARWDAFAANDGLQSMRNFDPAFYVTIANGSVFFGSSVDNAAHCLDAATGEGRWVHFTNSPVRLPPTIHGGRAYFGSDDGHAYCVDAGTGIRHWKVKPSPDPRLIPSNGKLISPWPVRSGVLVEGDTAYFAASLLPWETSYLCAVDAETGSVSGDGRFATEQSGVTFQGALLASSDRLYAPQGRSVPLVFESGSGKRAGSVGGVGGVYCVLTEDEQFIAMPEDQKSAEDTIRVVDSVKRQTLLTISGANRMIAAGVRAYFHRRNRIQAIDRDAMTRIQREINGLRSRNSIHSKTIRSLESRIAEKTKRLEPPKENETRESLGADEAAVLRKEIAGLRTERDAIRPKIDANNRRIQEQEAAQKRCELWTIDHEIPIGFMLAGDTLFVGGSGTVTAFDANDGKEIWSAQVEGKAYGLAAAGGRLFVSTDRGCIYCFAP